MKELTDQLAFDLGRRLAACPRFEWRPGMLVRFRYDGEEDDGRQYAYRLDCDGWMTGLGKESSCFVGGRFYNGPPVRDLWPDLRCPATRGQVLELVRGAYQPCSIYEWGHWVEVHRNHRHLWNCVQPFHDKRGALCYRKLGRVAGSSEADALVLALEAAP